MARKRRVRLDPAPIYGAGGRYLFYWEVVDDLTGEVYFGPHKRRRCEAWAAGLPRAPEGRGKEPRDFRDLR